MNINALVHQSTREQGSQGAVEDIAVTRRGKYLTAKAKQELDAKDRKKSAAN